jgi:hypothetical protein
MPGLGRSAENMSSSPQPNLLSASVGWTAQSSWLATAAVTPSLFVTICALGKAGFLDWTLRYMDDSPELFFPLAGLVCISVMVIASCGLAKIFVSRPRVLVSMAVLAWSMMLLILAWS